MTNTTLTQPVVDSLFYQGGTIDYNDVVYNNKYGVAFNSECMFIFKGKDLLKVVKYEADTEWAYKIMKTKVKIVTVSSFIKSMTDSFWQDTYNTAIGNILRVTKVA